MNLSRHCLVALGVVLLPSLILAADDKKLILIAGKPSHPPLMHEFRAGCLLLAQCLKKVNGLTVEVHDQGWVRDEATFEDADAIVIFADGGGRHPALQGNHLETLDAMSTCTHAIRFGNRTSKISPSIP